jgi:hypothetical protein
MAKAPDDCGVTADRVPDAPEWFKNLLPAFNSFFSDTATALAKGLTPGENLRRQTLTLAVETGTDKQPLSGLTFANGIGAKPNKVEVAQVEVTTAGGTIEGAVGCQWWELTDKGEIKVRYLAGLAAKTKYKITFNVE